VVKITYDPSVVSYDKIIGLFWDAHDPTTLNRQGADRGTQYRSIIIAQDSTQRSLAEKSKADAQARFRDPIVTEIIDETEFFAAEGYHQDFTARNPNHPYVQAVIAPKLEKLKNK
jgi:peptide-methionine (S)-S-oxide reductase